jgi:hypothetical protein
VNWRRAAVTGGITIAILGALGGCLALVIGPTPPEGDCSLTLRYDGRTYDDGGYGDHQRRPEVGPVIGRAEELSCDGKKIGTARIRAAIGVPREQAILHRGYPYLSTRGSLVTEKVPCNAPAAFTGRLLYVDGEEPARAGMTPPYVAVIQARRGTGLPLEGMRWVNVRARVTTRTEVDVDSLHETRVGKDRVQVETHCRGGRFVADRVVRRTRGPGPS